MEQYFLLFLFLPLVNYAGTSLTPYLESHSEALSKLEQNKDSIGVQTYTQKHFYADVNHFHYYTDVYYTYYSRYPMTNPDAHVFADQYYAILNQLEGKLFANAAGDGFIIGIFTAILNKLLTKQTEAKDASCIYNSKTLFAGIIASIALILYQNSNSKAVPYFTQLLDKQDNLFTQTDSHTFARCIIAMLGTSVGFLGTDYVLNKCIDIYKAIMKNTVCEENTEKPEAPTSIMYQSQ